MMYVLDTNTLIYFFKGMGNVATHLFEHSPKEIAIPSIVVYELRVGIAQSSSPEKREKQLQTLLSNVQVLDFTCKEAAASAHLRATLEAKGEPIGPMDTLIAGYALAHNYTLVTHNTKEFQKIENLKTVDWFRK